MISNYFFQYIRIGIHGITGAYPSEKNGRAPPPGVMSLQWHVSLNCTFHNITKWPIVKSTKFVNICMAFHHCKFLLTSLIQKMQFHKECIWIISYLCDFVGELFSSLEQTRSFSVNFLLNIFNILTSTSWKNMEGSSDYGSA